MMHPARAQKLLDAASIGGPLSITGISSGGANSTITLAYSMRQLKTTYDHSTITPPATVSGFTNSATPLLRVRRSTDSAQLDIGYIASGLLDTATLRAFVTANGVNATASGYVSVWFDQSGNSRDAYQTTLSLQPRIVNAGVVEKNENNIPATVDYGQKFVYDTSTITKPYNITGNHTITVVAQPKSYTSTGGLLDNGGTYLSDRKGYATNGLSSIKIIGSNWAAQIRNDAGTITSSYTGNIALLTTRTDAVTLVRSGNNYPLYVNGANAGNTVLSGANTLGPFLLGYEINASSQQTYFEEAIIFPSALSSTNLSALYTSQAAAFKSVSAGTGKLLDAYASNGPLNAVSASSGGANSSVAIAYSVRQLKTTYEHTAITPPAAVSGFTNSSSPLVRVRRSSDNNQLDIGYDANGYLDTATLKTFVGAGSGFISVWYDQSGNSRDALQSTQAAQPRIVNAGVVERNVNGYISIVDQNGLYVDNTASYGITGDRTVNIVVQPKAWTNGNVDAGNGTYAMDKSTGATLGLTSIKIISDKWSTQVRSNGDAFSIYQSYSGNSYASVSTTRADALTLMRAGDNYLLYVNATYSGNTVMTGTNTLEGFRLGYSTNTSQNMYYNEAIYFSSALSSSDRTSLQKSQNIFLGKASTTKLLDPSETGGAVSVVKETPTSTTLSNTSVALAYSMRLLKTNYEHTSITPPTAVGGFTNSTTPLLRVKRGNDNNMLDIGYTSDGMLDTVTLKNFVSNNGALPTNNGFVDTWYDQSGNSLDARTTVAGYEPLIVNSGNVQRNQNGLIAVTNTVQRFTCNTNINVTGDRTIWMVAQPFAFTNGAWNNGAGTYLNDRNSHLDNSLSSVKLINGKWSTQIRNSDGSGVASSYEGSIAVSNNRIDAVVLMRSGDDYPLYVNGIQSGTTTLAGTNTLTNFQLGYRYDLSSDNQYVYYSEVLIFPSALSTSDQQAILANQNSVFGLGSFTWNGSASSDWNTAANWTPQGIPDEASSVIVPSSGVTNALSITVGQTTLKAKKFTVNSGASVTINGNLSVSDSVNINGTSSGTGTITLTGSLPQYVKGSFPGLINNNVEAVYPYGNVSVGGTFTNGGIINMGTNTLEGSPTVTNNGTILTQSTSSTPLPSGKTWSGSGNGTVTYNAISGGQTIAGGTYNALTMNNTTGTQTLNGTTTVNTTITMMGGKLAIGSNTLNMNGTISGLTASGSLVANGSSSLSIGGSGALGSNLYFDQTTPGTTNRLSNLTYNRSAQTITLGSALQVSGIITPTAGTLAAGNLLTLASNATSTGMIATGSGSYITGTVTAERYIPSVTRRWRFLASPVIGATLADWKNEIYITGAGGAANGFDATVSSAPSVYSYNEATPGDHNTYGWEAATNINIALTTGKGFRVFIRGDRSDTNMLNGTNHEQVAVTMNAIGAVNTGNITMPVTYTSSGNITNDGWNLMGNPYPAPIDWNGFHDAGRTGTSPNYSGTDYAHLDAIASVFDANTNAYASYNAVSNIGIGVFSNGIIPSGAAFWVKAAATSPSMVMKEIYKSVTTPAAMFKSEAEPTFILKLIQDSINADEMIIKYIPEADKNKDIYDIPKFYGEINIASITDNNTFLSGNCKPFNGTSDTIRLSLGVGKTGNYSFQFKNVSQLVSHLPVHMVDAYAHRVIDMKSNNCYKFSVDKTDPTSSGNNRFTIVVGETPTTGFEEVAGSTLNMLVYPAITQGEITISNTWVKNNEANVKITDALGRQVAAFNNLHWNDSQIRMDLSAYKTGVYFILVESNGRNTVLKCIKQ